MTQKFWVTTQWPQYEVSKSDDFDIELQERHENADLELNEGDLIFIYELKTGYVEKGCGKRKTGKCGIVALVQANGRFEENPKKEMRIYYNGNKEVKMRWKRLAKVKTVSKNGFVSREKLNRILGYKSNYNLRGVGNGSGLKIINKRVFCQLLELFDSDQFKNYCKK